MIDDIITTLNAIEVHGEQNLGMLLGCINALKRLKEEQESGRQTNK